MDTRLRRFADEMESEGIDAVALVPGANFRRCFGVDFHQNERPLLVLATSGGRAAAIVPHLEAASFEKLRFDGDVFTWRDETGYAAAFEAAAGALGPLRRIGVEGQRMRVFDYLALSRAFPAASLTDAQRFISRARLVKTPQEVDLLRRAVATSETALESTLRDVRAGMTEVEIQSILIGKLFAAGAEGLSFRPIVAAGDNSAQPHARARAAYRLRRGDALLIDFGGAIQGYCADITRTCFVGDASDESRALYDVVARANAAGRAAARPGITAGELDDIVLTVLESSAYARFIRHKTGHGLGLDVHEDPYIMRGNAAVLERGMVFTIEPGLYILGQIGVRIEDDVVVTDEGSECLTSAARELRIVG